MSVKRYQFCAGDKIGIFECADGGLVRYEDYKTRVGKLEDALRSIIDSADDGRPVPEWLTERLILARKELRNC